MPAILSRAFALLFLVDLRALQLVRIIHTDRLPLRVEVDRADAAFAMPITGLLHASERQMNLRADSRSIDVRDARIDVANSRKRAIHILRIDRARQTVLDRIRNLDRLFK